MLVCLACQEADLSGWLPRAGAGSRERRAGHHRRRRLPGHPGCAHRPQRRRGVRFCGEARSINCWRCRRFWCRAPGAAPMRVDTSVAPGAARRSLGATPLAAPPPQIAFVVYVSVVPIGMPVVTGAVLAAGAREMVAEKAIVSRREPAAGALPGVRCRACVSPPPTAARRIVGRPHHSRRLSALEEMSGMEILCSGGPASTPCCCIPLGSRAAAGGGWSGCSPELAAGRRPEPLLPRPTCRQDRHPDAQPAQPGQERHRGGHAGRGRPATQRL